jgi:hypothetical protein
MKINLNDFANNIDDNKRFELINTFHYNYGEILNDNCCDLSESSNCLVIATNKCLYTIRLDINDWPSITNSIPPSKYINSVCKLNEINTNNNIKIQTSNSFMHLRGWKNNLKENSYQLFKLDLIDSIPNSKLLDNLFK